MPRRWIMALSVVWGTTLGSLLAFQAAALLLALGWVYLYGDGPWPSYYTNWVVPIAAAIAGLLGFGAVVAIVAWLRATRPALERRLAMSAALRWSVLAAPMVLMAALLWAVQRQEAAAERVRAEEDRIAHRQADSHRLISASWRLDPSAGLLQIAIAADGAAAGSYELRWAATGAGVTEPLGAGTLGKSLPSGRVGLSLDLDAAALARRYAQAVLSRAEPVEIDLPLIVELSLLQEGASAGETVLRVTAPLSFAYQPDGAVTFASEQP